MATSVQVVTQQPSSFTSFISASATRTSTSSRSTGTGFDPFNRGTVPPDAIRFFIIAAVVLGFFAILFFLCCISYRIRQMRMRRIVVAAFDQGIFDRERVRRRILQLRGDAPMHEVLKAKYIALDHPGYFETEAKQGYSGQPKDLDHAQGLEDILPLTAEAYKTVAEERKGLPDPTFTALPIERQLALLFQANGSREKRRAKKQAKLEVEQAHHSSLELEERPPQALNITILISMPNPSTGSEKEERELVLGSVIHPLPLGAKGLSDATTCSKGLESSSV